MRDSLSVWLANRDQIYIYIYIYVYAVSDRQRQTYISDMLDRHKTIKEEGNTDRLLKETDRQTESQKSDRRQSLKRRFTKFDMPRF